MTSKPLRKYNAALRALAAAKNVDEVKKVRNEAEAIRAYAKQAKNRTLELDAAEIRFRAERRIGQMIAHQKRTVGLAKGAARKGVGKRGSRADPHSKEITLSALGIDKHLANQARKLAAIPDKEFEKSITNLRAEILSAAGRATVNILRAAKWAAWERQKAKESRTDPRKEVGAYLALTQEDADAVHPDYAPVWARFELLLRENPSSPSLPPTVSSAAKIVANAIWRLKALTEARDWPYARHVFFEIFETMWDRIEKLQAKIAKERLQSSHEKDEPAPLKKQQA